MPLFPRTEPELRPLIAYIVDQARDRGITLIRTKLVKLLYLIDVERARSSRAGLTGLEWIFFHYGPFAFELIDTLEAMEGAELGAQRWGESVLYRGASDPPSGDDWPAPTRMMVDDVIHRFAPLELNELLDYVYFRTGPMVEAVRGQRLDMGRARDDRRPRRHVPLRAAPPPAGTEERLARWRASHAHRLAPVALDPPGSFLDEPDEDLEGDDVGGRLHVPDDAEL